MLDIPVFLQRSRVPGKTLPKFRKIRWAKMKAVRPEGERWIAAERWEVFIGADIPQLAPGCRYVWVAEGRKWAYLRDAENRAKIHISLWRKMQKTGRQVNYK